MTRMRATRFASALITVGLLTVPTQLRSQTLRPPAPSRVVLEGEIDVLYEDNEQSSRLLHFLHTDTRRIPLRFAADAPDLPSGSHVRVTGDLADGTLSNATVSTLAVSTSRTLGAQDVLVVLMNFSNNTTQPFSPSTISSVNAQVQNFYAENSYGEASLNFTVTGWHTISAANNPCDYYTWASQADAAVTTAGFTVTNYDHVVYAFPQTSACGWTGMGNVAGPRSWINGSYSTRTVAHEQGHNFGDHHSHTWRCDSTGCVSVDYGDDRDIMGASGVVGHMNAFQKERLGWLSYGTSPIVQEVSSSSNYWIEPYETAPTGFPKGLKIWNASAGQYYYVESRAKLGFDGNVTTGVSLHTGSPTVGDSSYELDLASTTTTWDSTLDVSQSFNDPALGLTITTLSADSSGALVQVTFGPQPCNTFAPTVSLSPSAASWVTPGSTVNYSVSVNNNDTSGCAAAAFSLTPILPAGWSAVMTPVALNALAPGATGSASIAVTIPSTAAGTQQFTVSARESGAPSSADASVSLIVASTLGVTVSTDKAAYNGGTITVSATVSGNQTAVSGAAVAFALKNGSKSIVLTGTTNASGVAVASYRLKAKDPKGAWQVTASATKDAVTGSGSASFTVQ
jgi:Gametolysin peptidase M11/NPCBM-associated, NEW3 domain of alpha-galactosidase